MDETIRGYVDISDIDTRTYRNVASMSTTVAAEISGHISRQIVDAVVKQAARHMNMHEKEARLFFEFLASDPELRDRFTAYKTAKRLRGE